MTMAAKRSKPAKKKLVPRKSARAKVAPKKPVPKPKAASKAAVKPKPAPAALIEAPVPKAEQAIIDGLRAKASKDRVAAAQKAEAVGKKASPQLAHALVAALGPDPVTREAALT